ncbi:DsbA family protein [Flavobacterium sp. '19STA2R22 D10 B1']|uniref:DsbA family protein n=1 Tax=Flavobacterium aerium TaxID=3037261 RepID=UPI00278C54A3|nr:DsbA family protein [Flavobacterium sp. '19STA2R22 D10 B1']
MKLIYIMDPLCGWCYGNSTNTLKIFNEYKDKIDFEVLPGGMWIDENTRNQSKQMASYFQKHDLQIEELTGTKFGDAYFEFIQNDKIVLDSEIPSRAIIAVQELWKEKTIPFTVAIQKARYFSGKDLNLEETYIEIIKELNLDQDLFLKLFNSKEIKTKTRLTFVRAKNYAVSFPTLLLEANDDLYLIEQGYSTYETITSKINTIL